MGARVCRVFLLVWFLNIYLSLYERQNMTHTPERISVLVLVTLISVRLILIF